MLHKIIYLILYLSLNGFLVAQSESVRVVGDSLVGKVINGENVREIIGNVRMIQGEVQITCNKAIQYLRRNEVKLLENVLVKQDSIEIRTERGYYFGKDKISYSDTSIFLNDGHIQLLADTGYYYFDEEKAVFINNVRLYDNLSTLKSNKLTYFNKLDEAVAVGNVTVYDTTTTVFADSLIHLRTDKLSLAFNNVKIINNKNNVVITGNKLEDYGLKNLTRITGNPLLIQIDSSDSGIVDTLIIASLIMETFEDSVSKLIAKDSVRIVKGNFASVNNFTLYFRDEEKIVTHRIEGEEFKPVLWYENTQLTGDSITIFTKDNQIDWINIDRNAFIMSEHADYEFRYDQISGKNIKMFFSGGQISKTEVRGSVLSIYFMFEDTEPNGLIKSSAENINIHFDSNTVSQVKMYGTPASEYHPENLVEGNEKEFTLPLFKIYSNKPKKKTILQVR